VTSSGGQEFIIPVKNTNDNKLKVILSCNKKDKKNAVHLILLVLTEIYQRVYRLQHVVAPNCNFLLPFRNLCDPPFFVRLIKIQK